MPKPDYVKICYGDLLDVLKRTLFVMAFTTEDCFSIKTEGDREAFEDARKQATQAVTYMLYTLDQSIIKEA